VVVGSATFGIEQNATALWQNTLHHRLIMDAAIHVAVIGVSRRFNIAFADAQAQQIIIGVVRHAEQSVKIGPSRARRSTRYCIAVVTACHASVLSPQSAFYVEMSSFVSARLRTVVSGAKLSQPRKSMG
jgi:hypothetical protein